ncbi:single-stranded-DNA-specific exonuclease RecJ [Pseudoxanthomonas winnipegensis]|uniref:Single-stranded-DNA-specific exonuclease RecJ n=1 Tax=Pseudoxanthomonas winnipegensis TaxID=2480810 RepID=A0ABY1WFL8_9GAMM|nr:single-stranded-DNA-specific exonuclease RecJ [Pseudoxanthomonas winnipegensis]TAA08974.1 single-stranded-DNA-specific exonuclease RecJ [Pseudoxanthomonas winnipegensis]TAA20674.1 single-stranded-DNA-specific exonuclease RecJ [Pseudoxanthomonas winnipegensis]TAH71673.1 single-stranded-DNA-specific exonuclease RecJ [Pseudoxanthomonas winnipegensis]
MRPATRITRRSVAAGGPWSDAVPPLLQRIYAGRGALAEAQARPRLAQLHPPELLGGMDAAVALLAEAIAQDRHIVVVGDFDCDGATACAVAVRGLILLGARHVTPAVPNRVTHGYGLSPSLVSELAALKPDLLVTVDHGIACHAGIAQARALGWQVLVTDHHLPGAALPPAHAIVNPNLAGDGFPSKALAGVGVMFYVLLALRRRLYGDHPSSESRAGADREHQTAQLHDRVPQKSRPDLNSLLDLVAVGTIADLVPLDANNRALVAAGLRRLRAGQGCAGLRALIEVCGRRAETLSAADVGFAVAPRLNAAGRLEDMSLGIACLLCDEDGPAREMAGVLHAINAERRGVQQQMTDAAEAALSKVAALDGEVPIAVCLFDADWHPGVVGLVASKMKDRVHRPVIAFAPAEPGSDALRGSARSIPGFHIRDALAAVDAQHPGLVQKFGGHAMAAGLSLDLAQLPAFEAAFHAYAAATLDAALLQAELLSDGELLPHEFDRAHAEALRDGGPWGQGFAEPLFDGVFEVIDWRPIGERHRKLVLRCPQRSKPLDAIHFNGLTREPPPPRLHIAYRLAPDDYRGGDAIQLIVEHCVPA